MTSPVARTTWEYLFVQITHRGDDLVVTSAWTANEDARFSGRYAHEALQQIGREGWELVAVDGADRQAPWYVFKRPA